jgi:heterodisulfide reductase subunit C
LPSEKEASEIRTAGEPITVKNGLNPQDCYQCQKCSAGCPVVFAMDYRPNQILQMISLGMKEQLLHCKTIWVCASCYTCTTRCPNDIDIMGVMDYLKERSVKSGRSVPQKNVLGFHRAFLDDIKLSGGRLNEPLLLALFILRSGEGLTKLKTGDFKEDIKLGLKMFKKGRLSIKPPKKVQALADLKNLFK